MLGAGESIMLRDPVYSSGWVPLDSSTTPLSRQPTNNSCFPPIVSRCRLRAGFYMLTMVLTASLLAIFEVLVYPIVRFVDPVLNTYHRFV